MRYLDTSLLVPFYVREPHTADAQNWLAELGSDSLAASPWGITEFSSALALKSRRGELSQADLVLAETELRRFVAGRTRIVEIIALDFYRAAELCAAGVGLRAGDALHLAIAERFGFVICTLDRGMWTAARALGLPFETF
jgi:predicted nucleic acid-binding protein